MKRISIVGPPGAGKTTLARQVAQLRSLDHVELDAHFHMPDWQPRPREAFRADIQSIVAKERWVIDGNYNSSVQDIVWGRADTVLWLDLPRRVVFPALLSRTIRRGLMGVELWNGNRERIWNLLDPRPEENVFLWSVTRFQKYRTRYAAATTDPSWGHLDFVRLRSRHDITRWLSTSAPR
jgi:adenylate kinase family enzyme